MNTLVKFTLSLSLIVFGLSKSTAQWNKKVVGNGNITTNNIATQSYDEVKVVGFMDVHLKSGKEGNISVTTDSNIQEYVIVELKGSTLVLRMENNVSLKTKKGVHITVPFKSISAVALSGSGDIDTKDTIKSNFLNISVRGSGDITLKIESNNVAASVHGSGDLEVSGTAKNLKVKISGSGDVEAGKLNAENTQVDVIGSGDARVTASQSLKAMINGSGDIEYSGNPKNIDKKVMGSGTISSN